MRYGIAFFHRSSQGLGFMATASSRLSASTEIFRRLLHRHQRPPAGSSPGTLNPSPTALPPRLSAIHYCPDRLEEFSELSAGEIPSLMEREGNLWLNVEGLGDTGLIEELGRIFDLHPLSLADIVHTDQRAKVETYEHYLFVVLRMIHGLERFQHEQLSLFLGKGFLITFQEQHGDCFELVRARLRSERGQMRRQGTDYLAYALIDAVVDSYFHPLEKLGSQLEEAETAVLTGNDPSILHALHGLKREVLLTRRAVWPLREVLNSLLREDSVDLITPLTRTHLRDCYDHAIQVMDLVETYRELAASQMELYVSTVGQRTNEIMKVLTMFAAIFIPLTFIAGIYGMNFDPEISPWNMPEIQWTYGYPLALLFMGSVTGCILFFFYRRGWFR